MFTGIIEEVGAITRIGRQGGVTQLSIACPCTVRDLPIGGSVAVNGACLTATTVGGEALTVDVIQETLRRTNLGELRVGSRVNLERPLAAHGRLEGHFVQGHVDAIARVRGRRSEGERSERFEVELPGDLERYVVEKGSIAIDGISLTVGEVQENTFAVYLIPHTLEVTTLGSRRSGDHVNLEVDILAKYVERQLGGRAGGSALESWLDDSTGG